jgi:hypothetical protein
MAAVLTVTLLLAACLGGGALVLRSLGLLERLEPDRRLAIAFALGFGLLGWLLFPLGLAGGFRPIPLMVLASALAGGTVLLRRSIPQAGEPWGPLAKALAAGLAAAALAGLAVALAPPADADSLAYHFALPKLFLQAGHPVFQARGLDGAIPLLVQMTYVPALGLGGERGLTLWCWATAWATIAVAFVLARPYLGRSGALALALVLATTPAWTYGAYCGQIEVRMALLMLAAAALSVRALDDPHPGWAIAAGLAVGFTAGAKYTGLIFVAAAGLLLLTRRGWLRRGTAFGLAAAVTACQWYGWNWWNSGDPLFPMLWGRLPYLPGLWDDATNALFKAGMANELAVPSNLAWALAYPLVATLDPPAAFQAGRIGFGPVGVLLAPFALAGAWRARARLKISPLLPVAAMVIAAYFLWFLMPSSQRLRHLLPLYPLALVLLFAAVRADGWRRPAQAAIAATIVLQLGGAGLFASQPARHLVGNESRSSWLARTVADFGLAEWANHTLGPGERLFNTTRTINYYLDVPYFYGHNWLQAQVGVGADATDAGFLAQLRRLGLTHLLVPAAEEGHVATRLGRALVARGCARTVAELDGVEPRSRTIGSIGTEVQPWLAIRLESENVCAK